MVNILICDDDAYTCKVMKKLMEDHPEVGEVYIAKNGEEGVDIVNGRDISLAFMDIDMPKMDGLEAAKLMKKSNPHLKIVFVTAYREYASDSYEIRAYDYIVKPIDFGRVKENLHRMIKESHGDKFEESLKNNRILMIKDKQNYFFVNMEEINYIEKDHKELLIHTPTKKYTTRAGLKDMEKKLQSNFFRTHKSYIVNLKNIDKIEPYGDSSYIIYFKDTEAVKNALITRDNIHLLRG